MNMRYELYGHVLLSGTGSWQEGGRIVWHGYWQLFEQNADQTLTFVSRGRTDDIHSGQDAAAAGRIAGLLALEAIAAGDCKRLVVA